MAGRLRRHAVRGFSKLLASAFAGYYLALFLILWCLILRGISIEFGGHINDRMWQGFWDFVFVVANTLLAILFGAAAGNLARGVPLDTMATSPWRFSPISGFGDMSAFSTGTPFRLPSLPW